MAPLYGSAMSPDQSSDFVMVISIAALVSVVLALISVSICTCCRKKPKQYASTTEEPILETPEQDPSIITAKSPPSVAEKVGSSDREPNPDEAKSFKLTSFQESSLRQVGGEWTPIVNEQRSKMSEEKTGQRPMPGQLQLQSKRVESSPVEPEKPLPVPEEKKISDVSVIGGTPTQEPSLRSAMSASSVGTQPAIATVEASSAPSTVPSTATTGTMPESASQIFDSSKTAAVEKSTRSAASSPARPQEASVSALQYGSVSKRSPRRSVSTRSQKGSVLMQESVSMRSQHDSVSHGSASSLMEGSARKGMDNSGSLGVTSASEVLGEKSDRIMYVPTRPFVGKKRRV